MSTLKAQRDKLKAKVITDRLLIDELRTHIKELQTVVDKLAADEYMIYLAGHDPTFEDISRELIFRIEYAAKHQSKSVDDRST